jgi:hypothetical protein
VRRSAADPTEGFEPNRIETWADPRCFARYEGGETWLHTLAKGP